MPSQVDNNRRSLAYPALIGKGKARVNFDNLQYQNPVNYEYFTFDYNNTIGKILIELSPNNAIVNSIILNVTELFTTTSDTPRVVIGAIEENVSSSVVALSYLVGTGNLILSTIYGPGMQRIFNNKTKITLDVRVASNVAVTAGKGHGMFQWLNLNLVESYRENR